MPVIKRLKRFAERAERKTYGIQEILSYAGLRPHQKILLRLFRAMANLPIPPRPEQQEQLVKQCRDLGIAEWRIRIAHRRTYSPSR